MGKIEITKMVASGNDFVVVGRLAGWPVGRLNKLAKDICDRKYGAGADGLLVLGKSKKADVRMRIFNPDGSEAQMCGNGARCVAYYRGNRCVKIETKAGIIESQVKANNVKIKLTDPKDIELDIPVVIDGRKIKVNFINTGVPHAVILIQGLDRIDVVPMGRFIRYYSRFSPHGANVDFAEALSDDSLKIRTYERGVEDETLACGTGAVASAIIFALKTQAPNKIYVHTRGGEVLTVYFDRTAHKFFNVRLEGKVRIVYKGEYNV